MCTWRGIIPSTAPSEMLHTAVRELLADEGFKIRSSLSRSAVSTAASFLSCTYLHGEGIVSVGSKSMVQVNVSVNRKIIRL